MSQRAQERPRLTTAAETALWDCSPASVKRIVEELGAAVHADGFAAEVRLEDNRAMLKCSEEVACTCLEQVVEDVDGGCTELIGFDVAE